MRLTKIYTRVGDKGTTMLASGATVSKSSLRIDAYGTVDELNAVVGMLRDVLMQQLHINLSDLIAKLSTIQNELFDLGGELATPALTLDTNRQQVVTGESIQRLELEMDEINKNLPPLANFVIPGGHIANSTAHLARTVCRRAERVLVALCEKEDVRDEARIYLNRLSDWLFVVCREISRKLTIEEVLWSQRGKK